MPIDFVTVTENMADGARRVKIKKAEGIRQARILAAESEAQDIKLINGAANQYFVGNAQLLKRLDTVEKSLTRLQRQNHRLANCELVNIIGELAGAPAKNKRKSGGRHEGRRQIGRAAPWGYSEFLRHLVEMKQSRLTSGPSAPHSM